MKITLEIEAHYNHFYERSWARVSWFDEDGKEWHTYEKVEDKPEIAALTQALRGFLAHIAEFPPKPTPVPQGFL